MRLVVVPTKNVSVMDWSVWMNQRVVGLLRFKRFYLGSICPPMISDTAFSVIAVIYVTFGGTSRRTFAL